MKNGIRFLLIAFCAFAVSTAFAGRPECVGPKDKSGPPDHARPSKMTILHCGCSDEADVMRYVEINVSSKSKGHLKHQSATVASCFDGIDTYVDFVRSGSDCQVDDGSELVDGFEFCVDKVAGDECGVQVID